jgi:hypothetical protein
VPKDLKGEVTVEFKYEAGSIPVTAKKTTIKLD